jgi:hypothetical protein
MVGSLDSSRLNAEEGPFLSCQPGRVERVSLEARRNWSPYKMVLLANATYELASSVEAESMIQLDLLRAVLFFMALELKRILVRTALRIPT